MSDQTDLLQRAARVLPGGVLGSHRSGPGLEFVVREGRGAYLWDMSGRRYLDYLLGSGPMLLGHAHPAVVPRPPKAFPAPMADSAGIPPAIDGEVLVAPYNDLATTEALIDAHHDELAAVIVEPYQRTIPPAPGFLEGLRRATHRHGVP